MPLQQLSLHHLVRFPEPNQQVTDTKYPTILALHGRGSNEEDLIGLAPYLPSNLLWISPRGPFTLGAGSFEWFPITQVGKPDPVRLASAIQSIDRFVDDVKSAYPIDPNRFYLLGFSQGSIVSLSYALSMPHRMTGVIAQSGYIPHEAGLKIDEPGVKGKPFLLTHGIHDPMLPVAWARRSRDTLQTLGTELSYHEFNMGHNVTAESVEAISDWLEIRLKQ